MADFDFDIGIIGGGAAGLTIASGAARLGAKTLLIEKEGRLGGDCLYFGCVPSKTLIKTAHVYHLMKKAREFGLPAPKVPPVDFSLVSARIKAVIATIQQHDSAERFCRLGVKTVFGEAVFRDERSVRLNGRVVSAKNWVLATGSSPAVPYIEGLDKTPYITNKEVFYLERLPSSMIVLGAGPVAVEMSQAFSRLGTKVTLIQRSGQILSKEDADMADSVMSALEKQGVRFYLGAETIKARNPGNAREVIIRTESGEKLALKAEIILVALGRRANTGGLGLENIGLEFTAKGIKVDKRLRTNHRHIYAAGDVTGAFQFTHAAGYEGGVVISNAIFHLPKKTDYTNLPWCTFTSPELASIGMNEKRAQAAGINYSLWTEGFRNNDRSLAEGEPEGKIKLVLNEKENPIGVQILGPHAGELLSHWVAVMSGGIKLSGLAAAVHPYPTLGEINKKVVGNLYSQKIFSDKVRKGLKLFFNLKGRACDPQRKT